MYRVCLQLRGSTRHLINGQVLPSHAGRRAVGCTPVETHFKAFYSPSFAGTRNQELKTHRYRSGWSACQNRNAGTAECTPPGRAVTSVAMDHGAKMLQVKWGEEEEAFPYVWLRDNCRCPACYHAASRSRLILMADMDLQAQPSSAEVLNGGQQVEVVWTDSHRSEYEAEWLQLRGFSEARRRARASRFRLERKYWGSELMGNLPEASFQEVMEDDSALLEWLRRLEVFGFVKVGGAPAEQGQVRRLAERIGFIRKTHYGEDFTVKVKQDPSNVAYLSGPLQLHADLPYYEYKPGAQFIHCIVQYQGVGGDSLIADAVHVARQLQQTCPEHYSVLTDTPVDWFDMGTDETGEFYKVLRLPMICLNQSGEIRRINLSQPQRDSYFSVPAGEVHAWYAALAAFHRLLTDPKYCIQFKMAPGTILTFDNLRIVHGRTGYMSGQGERHVEGCYVDWDEVRSRRRVLEAKLGPGSSVTL